MPDAAVIIPHGYLPTGRFSEQYNPFPIQYGSWSVVLMSATHSPTTSRSSHLVATPWQSILTLGKALITELPEVMTPWLSVSAYLRTSFGFSNFGRSFRSHQLASLAFRRWQVVRLRLSEVRNQFSKPSATSWRFCLAIVRADSLVICRTRFSIVPRQVRHTEYSFMHSSRTSDTFAKLFMNLRYYRRTVLLAVWLVLESAKLALRVKSNSLFPLLLLEDLYNNKVMF